MTTVPLGHVLVTAGLLFGLGLVALMVRRNVLFLLIGVEVMLNAAALAFVAAGAHWGQADGQVMFLFVLTMAAAEVAVGLALVLQLHRRFGTLDADAASTLRESPLGREADPSVASG